MTLAIDARTRSAHVWLFRGRAVAAQRAVRLASAGALLPAIERFLREQRVSLKRVRRVVVVDGPGMFSTLRASVSVAKALAWSLGWALARVRAASAEVPVSAEAFSQSVTVSGTERFQPHYGQQPSITLKPLR